MNSMVIVEYTSKLMGEKFFNYKIHRVNFTDYKDLYNQLVWNKKLGDMFESASKFVIDKNKNVSFGVRDHNNKTVTGKRLLIEHKNTARNYCSYLHHASNDIKLHIYKPSYSIHFSNHTYVNTYCSVIHYMNTNKESIHVNRRFFSVNRFANSEIVDDVSDNSDSSDSQIGVSQWRYDYEQKDVDEGKNNLIVYKRYNPVNYFIFLFLLDKRHLKTFRNNMLFDYNVLKLINKY